MWSVVASNCFLNQVIISIYKYLNFNAYPSLTKIIKRIIVFRGRKMLATKCPLHRHPLCGLCGKAISVLSEMQPSPVAHRPWLKLIASRLFHKNTQYTYDLTNFTCIFGKRGFVSITQSIMLLFSIQYSYIDHHTFCITFWMSMNSLVVLSSLYVPTYDVVTPLHVWSYFMYQMACRTLSFVNKRTKKYEGLILEGLFVVLTNVASTP